MNKAFEKILDRLEELRKTYDEMAFIEMNTNGHTLDFEYAKGKKDVMFDVKQIVQEVTEEYNNGWIPCSERLPRDYTDVLADVRGIGFDSSKDAEMVGHFYENGKWFYSHGMQYIVDGKKTKVIAWKPLPEPYKEEKNA